MREQVRGSQEHMIGWHLQLKVLFLPKARGQELLLAGDQWVLAEQVLMFRGPLVLIYLILEIL